MRETISISLPADEKQALDEFTENNGVSRSDAVRAALRDYLFIQRFRALRRKAIPYAEAQGIYTDEDVFREFS